GVFLCLRSSAVARRSEGRRSILDAGSAAAKQGDPREQHCRYGNGDAQHDDNDQGMRRDTIIEHRKVENAGKGDTPARESVGQRRRMHEQEEVPEEGEADRGDDNEYAAQHQQQGDDKIDPQWNVRVHSITSPRRMNFASADELTKLKTAISSAPSK